MMGRAILHMDMDAFYASIEQRDHPEFLGRPVIFGHMPAWMKTHVQFGLDVHRKTYKWIKEGVVAMEVAKKYIEYFKEHGYGKQYLYGPCHGCGIIEVERPWMETISDYRLKENMTFMADTFFTGEEYGFRWEDGFRVKRTEETIPAGDES